MQLGCGPASSPRTGRYLCCAVLDTMPAVAGAGVRVEARGALRPRFFLSLSFIFEYNVMFLLAPCSIGFLFNWVSCSSGGAGGLRKSSLTISDNQCLFGEGDTY